MPKQNFYAVQKGRKVGVFLTWAECEEQVRAYPGAVFKRFSAAAEAENFVKSGPPTMIPQVPVSTENNQTGQKRAHGEDTSKNQPMVVYSDGACKGNGQPGSVAGVGVYWGPGDPRNIAERCPGDQTNNRAELIAIIRVLETAPVRAQKLLIKTDSRYSINCFEKWLPKWQDKGFKTTDGDPVKNVRIIKYLSSLLNERGVRGQPVILEHVRGHSGDPGNDGADAQANLGTMFPLRPDLDWELLKDRASKTIDMLVDTTTPRNPPAPVETPGQRPSKISKNLDPTELAGPGLLNPMADKPSNRLQAPVPVAMPPPTLSLDSPLHSPVESTKPRPTIYQKLAHQTVKNTPNLPNLPIISVSPFANQPYTPSLESAPQIRNLHHKPPPLHATDAQSISTKEPVIAPKSPLKVSRVHPPLVPVSANDINFDDYGDCLLEGDDWAKEIQDLDL